MELAGARPAVGWSVIVFLSSVSIYTSRSGKAVGLEDFRYLCPQEASETLKHFSTGTTSLAFCRSKCEERQEPRNTDFLLLLSQRPAWSEGNVYCLSPLHKTDTAHGGKTHGQRPTRVLGLQTAALHQTFSVLTAYDSESLESFGAVLLHHATV